MPIPRVVPADEFSWDDPARTYAESWREVVFEPRRFFSEDRPGRGLQGPIGFLLVSLAIGGLGLAVFGWGAGALPRILIGGLLRTLVAALLLWLIATRLFGGKGDYESTLRVLAYASALTVFIFVPGVRVLAKLYALFIVVIGLERAHDVDTVRAVLTILVAALCALALHGAVGGALFGHVVHPAWMLRT